MQYFHMFAVIAYVHQVNSGNLAYNKPAYLSSIYENHNASLGVDGNKDGENYAHANDVMPDGWFVVDLNKTFHIEHILLFNRNCKGCENRMDKFIVGLTNSFHAQNNPPVRGKYTLSGQYPSAALPPGQPMRVNCNDTSICSRYVIIQTDNRNMAYYDMLGFSELEVYPKEIYIQYLGCYTNFPADISRINPITSVDECLEFCMESYYIYGALKNGSLCFCGNITNSTTSLAECNLTCINGKYICGGAQSYSVHTSCSNCDLYSHSNPRKTETGNYCGIEKCNDGWKGSLCNERDCSVNNGACGEFECKKFNFGSNLTTVSECVCPDGFQKKSLFDNCTDIDECEFNPCNTTTSTKCQNTPGSYTCLCKPGFENLSFTDCTDIDECLSNPCKAPGQNYCINIFGGFNCSCYGSFNDGTSCEVGISEFSSYSQTGRIVGGVLGSLLAITMVVIIIFVLRHCWYKRKASNRTTDTVTMPHPADNDDKIYNSLENIQTNKHVYSNLSKDKRNTLYNSLQSPQTNDTNTYTTLTS